MTKGEAAVENVKMRRTEQQEQQTDTSAPDKAPPPGKKTALDKMPWIPSFLPYKLKETTKYEPDDHRRYVAIVANCINADVKFRFKHNLHELEEMDKVLSHERRLYEEEMLTKIEKREAGRFNFSPLGFRKCFEKMAGEKCSAILADAKYLQPKEDGGDDSSSSSSSEEGAEQVRAQKPSLLRVPPEVLSEGEMVEFELPEMEVRCHFPFNAVSICDYLRGRRAKTEPIERDREALELALKNRVSHVMDASTLRHLMSDKWAYRSEDFSVKLVVQNRSHRGQSRRLLFFSKPVLMSPPSSCYIVHQCVKWSVKSQLIKRPGETIDDSTGSAESPRGSRKDETPAAEETTKTVLSLDMLDRLVARGPPPKTPRKTAKQVQEETAKHFNATLPKIPIYAQSPRVMPTPRKSLGREEKPPFPIAQDWPPKKRYEVVDVGSDQRVLVRASNHGVCGKEEGGRKHVAIVVKLDYLPEIGAEKLHREELLWSTLTSVLKGSDENVLFRMNPLNSHCLQLQKLGKNSAAPDAPEDQVPRLVAERCERLRRWMEEFDKLNAGEYLVTFARGGRLHISPRIASGEDDSDSQFHTAETIKQRCFEGRNLTAVTNFKAFWNGIDPHIPLRWHIVRSAIPGAYPPATKKPPASKPQKRPNEQPAEDEGEPAKRRLVTAEPFEAGDLPAAEQRRPLKTYEDAERIFSTQEAQEPVRPDELPPIPQPTEPIPQPTEPIPQPTEPIPQPTEPIPQPTEPIKLAMQEDGVSGCKLVHCSELLDDEAFKDCAFQVGGSEVLPAHKCVLARCSSVLRAKFLDESAPLEQKDGGRAVIKVPQGYSSQSVRAMIHYAYTGRVDPKKLSDCAVEVFRLAGEYGIKQLQQLIGAQLPGGINSKSVLGMAQIARDLSRSDLFMECARFVDENIVELSTSEEWKKLKKDGTLIADLLENAAISRRGGGG